ncbi:hypothetical protein DES43_11298 [Aquamicrobium defluvii]|uniref:Uncharacterized protein n=1 Tax=Aquamicrobium defluvii TaxID=69279 RepID=A0A4R6YF37_9HYPH|nr:hypothetical protein DES43_11298 [Aquamicrobium defluvii]
MLRPRLLAFASIVVGLIGVNRPGALILSCSDLICSFTERRQVDIAPQGAPGSLIAALAFDFDNE